jgi:ubiquinone biosynthesis protein COQ4
MAAPSALARLPRQLLPATALRSFSVLSRPPPNYPGHIPLTTPERIILGAGSAVSCFFNPRRADLIAACGEATAVPYFIYRLRDAMLADATGRRILRDRPRITSKSLDLERLRGLPEGTVGRGYVQWLDREGVSPDTRSAVGILEHRGRRER